MSEGDAATVPGSLDPRAPGGRDRRLLFAPRRHLILAPHFDDAALSLGGTAALLAAAGLTPEIAVVFGAEPPAGDPLTPFAAAMHVRWGLDRGAVVRARRAEEDAAAALLGATVRVLPFPDAIYRGDRYASEAALFGTPAADEADLPGDVAAALGAGDSPTADRRVYAPLGVGSHVDHQQVFAAGLALSSLGQDVWFYEDLPYAGRRDALASRLTAVAAQGVSLAPAATVGVVSTWDRKIGAVLTYPSQLEAVFSYLGVRPERDAIDRTLRGYAEAVGGGVPAERFWLLASPRG